MTYIKMNPQRSIVQPNPLVYDLGPFHIPVGRLYIRPTTSIPQHKGIAFHRCPRGPGVAQVVRTEFPDDQNISPKIFTRPPNVPLRFS